MPWPMLLISYGNEKLAPTNFKFLVDSLVNKPREILQGIAHSFQRALSLPNDKNDFIKDKKVFSTEQEKDEINTEYDNIQKKEGFISRDEYKQIAIDWERQKEHEKENGRRPHQMENSVRQEPCCSSFPLIRCSTSRQPMQLRITLPC